ncbi:MAG: hypothetical protein RHS_1320 [Robinsoniella sp. RHS]|nr:MAG: hypothetical protein RHS_1320 [Robinsoniella sp. RHS]
MFTCRIFDIIKKDKERGRKVISTSLFYIKMVWRGKMYEENRDSLFGGIVYGTISWMQ